MCESVYFVCVDFLLMRHFAPTFCFEIDQEFEFFIETSLINNVAKSLNFYLFILQTGDSMDIICGLSRHSKLRPRQSLEIFFPLLNLECFRKFLISLV